MSLGRTGFALFRAHLISNPLSQHAQPAKALLISLSPYWVLLIVAKSDPQPTLRINKQRKWPVIIKWFRKGSFLPWILFHLFHVVFRILWCFKNNGFFFSSSVFPFLLVVECWLDTSYYILLRSVSLQLLSLDVKKYAVLCMIEGKELDDCFCLVF